MILFLSRSFLNRYHLISKPSIKAMLVGHRNLFFFAPDSAIPCEEITPAVVDEFLKKNRFDDLQLLGFLSSDEIPLETGFIHVQTSNSGDPEKWNAWVAVHESGSQKKIPLEIKFSTPPR
jgi:hypothetical protein